jgi:hypothetical protein
VPETAARFSPHALVLSGQVPGSPLGIERIVWVQQHANPQVWRHGPNSVYIRPAPARERVVVIGGVASASGQSSCEVFNGYSRRSSRKQILVDLLAYGQLHYAL